MKNDLGSGQIGKSEGPSIWADQEGDSGGDRQAGGQGSSAERDGGGIAQAELFDIGCDPNNPVPVQIQAIGTALPYLAPRLQVTAQVTRGVGDFSDCKTVDELVERVEQDLGAYWAQLFRKAVASDDPGAVIDAEIVPEPTAAEPEQKPEPAS